MILTYKVKHGRDFTRELLAAKKIAEFAVANRDKTAAIFYRHFGLPGNMTNSIVWKYARNKKCKKITRMKIPIRARSIKYVDGMVIVKALKMQVPLERVESFWVFIEKLLLLQREKDIEVINSRFIQGGKTSPQSFNSGIASAVWAIRNQDEKAKITLQQP